MKRLRFHYHMDIAFYAPVTQHRFTLKCIPKSDDRQEISNLDVTVYPHQFLSQNTDSFHNISLTGYAPDEHEHFYIDVMGIAQTGLESSSPIENPYQIGFYKYHTTITKPGSALNTYYQSFSFAKSQSNFDKAFQMMKQLYLDFSYVQNVTSIETTAEEAMTLKKGVCQDYAHILISLCRMASIPARYVVGLLIGEGYSHAWVEIFESGSWIGLDPTNNTIVHDQHIKISNGRDCTDCTLNHGLFTGGGNQRQTVSVIVYETN